MIASRAVSQPAVLGRKRYPFRIFTVSEPWPWSETRRIEAVTTAAPDAANGIAHDRLGRVSGGADEQP